MFGNLLENIPSFSRLNRNLPGAANPSTALDQLHQKAEIQDQIGGMSALSKGWDSYDAEAPSQTAIQGSLEILGALHRLGQLPIKAVPLADGGVSLVMTVRPHYAAIEVFNDGEIVAAFSDLKKRHEAWQIDLDDISRGLLTERLRELAHG